MRGPGSFVGETLRWKRSELLISLGMVVDLDALALVDVEIVLDLLKAVRHAPEALLAVAVAAMLVDSVDPAQDPERTAQLSLQVHSRLSWTELFGEIEGLGVDVEHSELEPIAGAGSEL